VADQVYMDVPAVRGVAKTCQQVGEVLAKANQTMEGLVTLLRTTAFMGLVGGLALAQFMDSIRPYIEQVSQKCLELSSDLNTSIDAYQNGDQQGATRFY
jgi:hypothetical protein